MSVKRLVFSHKRDQEVAPISLSLQNPRAIDNIFLAVEVFNGNGFSIDIGGGSVLTYPSNPNLLNLILDKNTGTASLIYEKPNNIKTLKIGSDSYNFDVLDVKKLVAMQTLYLNKGITCDIVDIPISVREFVMNGGEVTNDYAVRRSFLFTTMRRFVLANDEGTGLTSGAVDNLLQDLSLASWGGVKLVIIAGINSARTSASDGFVTTLEGKGVTVITN